jgi:hypothetical protein
MGDGQAMIRKITGFSLLATALLSLFPLACQPGGVGDPCTPEDEYTQTFPGYNVGEVNAEARSFQCETRLCLVDHFQGRVSCPYGQDTPAKADFSDANCHVPGDASLKIQVQVNPQLVARQTDNAVYCSCRCDGEDKNARYCKCPSGYNCLHDIDDIGVGNAELAGSYCIRSGSSYPDYEANPKSATCAPTGYPTVPNPAGSTLACGSGDPDQG